MAVFAVRSLVHCNGNSEYCCTGKEERFFKSGLCCPQIAPQNVAKTLQALFSFSLVWSLGATTDTNGRAKFNKFLHKLLLNSVELQAERTDFDLGPGIIISPAPFEFVAHMPEVRCIWASNHNAPRILIYLKSVFIRTCNSAGLINNQ